MAQDVHHVCRCASSVDSACFDADHRREGEQTKSRRSSAARVCSRRTDVVGRVSLDLSVQRTPLLQPAAWRLVCWPLGLVFTIDLRPCEAASHHVGSLTQTHTSRLPSLGRAGRPMLGLTLSSITRRGSMCPLPSAPPCPPTPTCHLLPQTRSADHVPEDLARYATGRRPLSYNAQAGASDVVPEVARRATNALLKGETAWFQHGRVGVGRGTAGLVESESSQSRAADRPPLPACPVLSCLAVVSLLTFKPHPAYHFAGPPSHADCRTRRQKASWGSRSY